MKILALDIGGSSIKRACFTMSGQETKFELLSEIATPPTGRQFMTMLDQLINESGNIVGVAISSLGAVDTNTNRIISAGAIQYLPTLEIAETISKRHHVNCRIINDGKAATLGEYYCGNLAGVNCGVCLVLGSGIGGGILYHGKILEGKHFAAGEFSNIRTNNRWDELNKQIFYKENSSLVLNREHRLNSRNNGREFFANLATDSKLQLVLKAYCRNLAVQMYNLQLVLDPDKFVIGGGISAQPMLLKYLQNACSELAQRIGENNLFPGYMPSVQAAKHHNTANIYGALGQYLTSEHQFTPGQVSELLQHS